MRNKQRPWYINCSLFPCLYAVCMTKGANQISEYTEQILYFGEAGKLVHRFY